MPRDDLVSWKYSYGGEDYYEEHMADLEKAKEMAAYAPRMSGPFRFFGLPFEIRSIIYEHSLTSHYGIHVQRHFKDWKTMAEEGYTFEGDYAAALLYTCREAYDVGRKAALSRNTIKFFDDRSALRLMRHLKMDKEKHPYKIQGDQDLHSLEGSRQIPFAGGPEPDYHERYRTHFMEMIDFCKENSHLQVKLNITALTPADFGYVRQPTDALVAWYRPLVARVSDVPASLTIGFELQPYKMGRYDPRKWYDIIEPKLRCWAPGGLKWPPPNINDESDSSDSDSIDQH